MKANSTPFLVFQWDHLLSTSGIIYGWGSFTVHFGDHFRSGYHLRCKLPKQNLFYWDFRAVYEESGLR